MRNDPSYRRCLTIHKAVHIFFLCAWSLILCNGGYLLATASDEPLQMEMESSKCFFVPEFPCSECYRGMGSLPLAILPSVDFSFLRFPQSPRYRATGYGSKVNLGLTKLGSKRWVPAFARNHCRWRSASRVLSRLRG